MNGYAGDPFFGYKAAMPVVDISAWQDGIPGIVTTARAHWTVPGTLSFANVINSGRWNLLYKGREVDPRATLYHSFHSENFADEDGNFQNYFYRKYASYFALGKGGFRKSTATITLGVLSTSSSGGGFSGTVENTTTITQKFTGINITTGKEELKGLSVKTSPISGQWVASRMQSWLSQDFETAVGTYPVASDLLTNESQVDPKVRVGMATTNANISSFNPGYFPNHTPWTAPMKARFCYVKRKNGVVPYYPDAGGEFGPYGASYRNGEIATRLVDLITANIWRDDRGTFAAAPEALTSLPWRPCANLNHLVLGGPGNTYYTGEGVVGQGMIISSDAAVTYRLTLRVLLWGATEVRMFTVSVPPGGAIIENDLNDYGVSGASFTLKCSKIEQQIDTEWIDIPIPETFTGDANGFQTGLIGMSPASKMVCLTRERRGTRWGHPQFYETELPAPHLIEYYREKRFNARFKP